ncbi:MAG: radical SAM/SPASM domain-containing protein [Candidatus Adiutrix sp.]
MTAKPFKRTNLMAKKNPDAYLAEIIGEKFVAYRQNWAQAELGHRPNTPLHLDVDVTTACNLACPMCPAGNSGHIFPGFKKGLFLKRSLYHKALDEGASFSLPSIRLGLTGEPLLVPDIEQWVKEAQEAKILDISLITNGLLLTPEKSENLIKAGLTRLMISIDAGSQQVYEKVRPKGDWFLLIQNIKSFLAARQSLAQATPILRLSFVEMEGNISDRQNFENIFGPLADYLTFQTYQNILGAEQTDFGLKNHKMPQNGFCPDPFTRLALYVDGALFPCCSDFGRQKPLANLASTTLLDFWQSPKCSVYANCQNSQGEPCRSCSANNMQFA